MLGFTYSEVHKGFWGWWRVPESRHLFGLRYAALSQTTALGALVVCSKFQREDIVGIFWLHFFSRNNQWENITSDIISWRGGGVFWQYIRKQCFVHWWHAWRNLARAFCIWFVIGWWCNYGPFWQCIFTAPDTTDLHVKCGCQSAKCNNTWMFLSWSQLREWRCVHDLKDLGVWMMQAGSIGTLTVQLWF